MKSLLSLALLGALLATASCSSDSTASDDIVARVNGKAITTAELDKQFQAKTASQQPPSPEEALDLKLQLLNEMINDQILLEQASKETLTASDAEVDVKFNEFKSQYTAEQFEDVLKQQKMTVNEIRDEMRKGLTIEKLVNKEITAKISVSEAEIKTFFDKNKQNYNLPEQFHVAHILITPVPDQQVNNLKKDDAKTPEEARAKATKLLHDIQGGQDFATVARDYSEDPTSAASGGDLSFQSLENLNNVDPRFAQAVQHMKIGETFPQVVETKFGYHIVKLLEKDAGGQKDLSDPRVQAQVRQVIFDRKDQLLKAAFSENARNNSKVYNYLAQRVLDGTAK